MSELSVALSALDRVNNVLEVAFSESTQTIRQMPENYMLAHFSDGHWLMEPDLAANKELVVALTLSLMEYEHKYNANGIHALTGLSPYMEHSYIIG